MAYRLGSGYLGTEKWEVTSTVDTEIIPNSPENWTMKYNLYKFSFFNPENDATVVINNKHTIFIPSGAGFTSDNLDTPIYSFVIKESGVKYCFISAY